jgi:hypothetical protein
VVNVVIYVASVIALALQVFNSPVRSDFSVLQVVRDEVQSDFKPLHTFKS